MADDLDNKIVFDPITAVRYLEFSKLVYPALYAEFNQIFALQGAKLWSLDDQGFLAALKEFSRRFNEFLRDHPEAAGELDKVAPRVVVEGVFQEADKFPGASRRKRIEAIVSDYGKEARRRGIAIANEEAVNRALAAALAADKKPTSTGELLGQASSGIAQNPDLKQVLAEAIDNHKDEIATLARDEEIKSEIVRAALTAPVELPHVYTRIVTGLLAENPNYEPLALRKDAERLTRLAAGLLVGAEPEISGRLDAFLKTTLETGGGKGAKLVTGVISGALDKEQALQFWDMATGEAFKKTASDPKEMAKLGPELAASPLFAGLKEAGKKTPTPAPVVGYNPLKRWAAAFAVGQAVGSEPKKIVEDVFTLAGLGVFRGDLVNNKPQPAPPGGFVAGATAHTTINAPAAPGLAVFLINTRQLFLAAVYAHAPKAFHLDFSAVSGWLLMRGAREAVGGTMVKAAAETGIKGLIGKLGIATVGGAIGGPFGFIASIVGGNLLTKFAGGITNRIRGLFGGGVRRARGFSIDQNLPLMLAVIILAAVSLFILPFSFNPFNNVAEKVRTVALQTSGEKAIGGGAMPNFAQKSYQGIPLPAASAVTRCPVELIAGEKITQGPNQGNHVGDEANSYDIGLPTSTAVHPSHSGVVVEAFGDSPGNSNGSTSPGNYVKIEGTAAGGQTYFTYYEHLFDIARGLKVGDSVTPETVLGNSDNTGNSSGPHLHYQCNGPICASMMPAGCGGT